MLRENGKFLTVYRVGYTPIEALSHCFGPLNMQICGVFVAVAVVFAKALLIVWYTPFFLEVLNDKLHSPQQHIPHSDPDFQI